VILSEMCSFENAVDYVGDGGRSTGAVEWICETDRRVDNETVQCLVTNSSASTATGLYWQIYYYRQTYRYRQIQTDTYTMSSLIGSLLLTL